MIPKIKDLKAGDRFVSVSSVKYEVLQVYERVITCYQVDGLANAGNSVLSFTQEQFDRRFRSMIVPPTREEQKAIDLLKESGYKVTK